ncbi:hypothetical protein VOLCADRAFT_98928 [Volvox carteri f. nagariensis]|uniref:Uncharacterized protein n=1 Tax=Volvox carteri f. nagariensis TaxID=3068 RepID=D8UGM5_VOLCA|nr:uncharacterized protein VOLCADRAFT_98928 [Volvox carteri f. nagariensis]EFJ41147.1 hypothetical protein VOLCADRAFT_98928 [Volvox carteri f. nagariensis]|eukprot:XP_002957819.1 hypothetical protein VOLCADRAFT_98928 [Volvox carteri f. nagariensis]
MFTTHSSGAPQLTIHHQYHATYDVPDPKPPIDEKAFLERLKEDIREKYGRITRPMDAYGMPHNLHLYLDTDNAPASAVCNIMFKVADEVDAVVLVLAAHGKVISRNPQVPLVGWGLQNRRREICVSVCMYVGVCRGGLNTEITRGVQGASS